jgi:hypothetical protein
MPWRAAGTRYSRPQCRVRSYGRHLDVIDVEKISQHEHQARAIPAEERPSVGKCMSLQMNMPVPANRRSHGEIDGSGNMAKAWTIPFRQFCTGGV